MSKRQNGSAHVVIIIILVLAILGLLGFVFYQNFIAKKSNDTSNQKSSNSLTNSSPKDQLTQNFSITLGNRTLTMKYPDSWKVTTVSDNSGEQGIDHEVSKTIASPDGKYVISASLGDGGFGGGCPVGTTTFTSTQLTDLPNGTGAFLLEYTSSDATAAAMKIEPKSVDKNGLVKGQDACNVTLGLFNTQGGDRPDSNNPVMATIGFSAPNKSGDYQTAKQILLSLKG